MSAPWQNKRHAIGTFVKIPAPEVVELLSAAGLDFIVIDAEHGAFDVRTISTMVSVARGYGLQVLVRVPGHAPRDVQPALDAGADGLFIPHVDSPQIAQAVVRSCRFPPLGDRGGSPFTRPGDWGRLDAVDYVSRGNNVTIVAQIESSQGAATADKIGAVPGIDAVFIGPFDLALASGLPPGGSELHDLIRSTEQRSAAAGVPVGGMAPAAEPAVQMLERGLDFVLVGNDASLLTRAAHVLVEQIRSHRTGTPSEQPAMGSGDAMPIAPSDNNCATAELRQELEQVVIALWHEIDHHDGVEASTYFTADAELRFQDAAFRGTAQIDDVYVTRAARGPRVSRHVVTNLHVIDADEANARATSTLILYAEDGTPPRPTTTPALVADVADTFERHDGRWLIRSRQIQHLFIAATTVLAVPTA